jgi:hypothetical protein
MNLIIDGHNLTPYVPVTGHNGLYFDEDLLQTIKTGS